MGVAVLHHWLRKMQQNISHSVRYEYSINIPPRQRRQGRCVNIQVHKEVFQRELFPRKFIMIHVDPMVSTIKESQKSKSKPLLKTFDILITLDTKPWI